MFKGLFENFLDLIYKKKCLVCNCSKTDDLLCKTCAKDVEYLSTFPHRIYNSTPIYSATLYKSTIKTLIHILKFQHKKKASAVLAQILNKYFQQLNLKEDFVVIYPNSNILKNLSRGYEHTYLIAKEFCNLSGLKLYKNAIKKIKHTTPQYKAKDRFKNIKGAFKINKKYIESLKTSHVLLIDDIITSGATIEEIVNILKNEGIDNITVLSVSKTTS